METKGVGIIAHGITQPGRVSASSPDRSRRWRWAWLAALLLFGAAQILISVLRFDHLQADTLDLGFQAQMLWLISHGHWYAFSSVFQTPALATDGSLWMYPLAYVFRYAGGVYALFTVQAAATVLAAWGVMRTARAYGWSPRAAYGVSLLFCLAPGVLGASQFDYHPDFLALPGVVWGYVWYREGRWSWAALAWLAAALAKNMAVVGLVGFGFGLLVTRRVRHGLLVMAASLALLALECGWVFPHWFPGQVAALNVALYPYLGHSTVGVAVGVVTHLPLLLRHVFAHPAYWLWIFGPVLGLALLGSASLWAVLALFVLNAAAVFAPQQMVSGQYQLLLTAWLFLALVEALSRWPARHRVLLLAVADATLLFEAVLVTFVVSTAVAPQGPVTAARAAVATVPGRAIVWTQNRLGTLLYDRPFLGVDRSAGADRALVDALPVLWAEAPHAPTALVATLPITPLFGAVMARAERAGYRITFHQGSAVVLQGEGHFAVPPPATAIANGYQPHGAWTEPAWAVRAAGARVDWATGTVSRSTAGPLLGPIQMWATGPARLTLTFTAPSTGAAGTLTWQTVSAAYPSALVRLLWQGVSTTPMAQVPGALHQVPVVARSTPVSLTIPVTHAGWIVWLLSMPPGVSVVQIHWAPVSPATP